MKQKYTTFVLGYEKLKNKMKLKSIIIGGLLAVFALGFMAAKSVGTKSKVGYINTNELWALMPEKDKADEQLKKMESEMVAFLQAEQKTLQEGVIAFQRDSAGMSDLVKNQTYQKLVNQQENLQKLPEEANKELMAKQEQLYKPIRLKMQNAIDKVAEENGYDYIMDAAFGNLVFSKNKEDNILSLVKVKLNL
jgi:outer membrane protein